MKTAIAVIATLVLAGCQTTGSNFVAPKTGSTYQNVFDLGNGSQLPLPEGTWTLVGNKGITNNTGQYLYQPILADFRNGVVQKIVWATTAIGGKNSPGFTDGYIAFRTCSRTNMHFVKTNLMVENGDQDCWFLNHFVMSGTNDRTPPSIIQSREYFAANKIKIPLTAIYSGHHLANFRLQFLTARYFFNPEVEGFSPPAQAAWSINDWHKDRYFSDPKKVAYIEKIKAWGAQWHQRVKQGFAGKLGGAARPNS